VVLGQNLHKNEIIELITKTTEIKSEKIKKEYVVFKSKPNFPEIIIVFVPVIKFLDLENGEETYTQKVFLINKLNREILTQTTLKTEIISDWLIKLEKITIDTAKYVLNDKTRAFGIKRTYAGGNPYHSVRWTELSLFIEKDKMLKEIISNLKTKHEVSSSKGGCSKSRNTDINSILIVSEKSNSIFNDLKIIEKETSYDLSEDCERQLNIVHKPKKTLIYKYSLKKEKYVL